MVEDADPEHIAESKVLDQFLSHHEKYLYLTILTKVHQGSHKRANKALVILQKILKNKREAKLKK